MGLAHSTPIYYLALEHSAKAILNRRIANSKTFDFIKTVKGLALSAIPTKEQE